MLIKNTVRLAMRAAMSVALASGTLLALTPATLAQSTFQAPAAEPGTDIPEERVNFGMRPFADNTST